MEHKKVFFIYIKGTMHLQKIFEALGQAVAGLSPAVSALCFPDRIRAWRCFHRAQRGIGSWCGLGSPVRGNLKGFQVIA